MIRPHDSIIVQTLGHFIIPVVQLFGLYVLFFGQYGPGGGFVGGVILGTGMILSVLIFGHDNSRSQYARNVLNWEDANTSEVDPKSTHKVIDLMEEQKKVTDMGGTMRLGACDCELVDKSIAKKVYKRITISERHRHRFEFNNDYKDLIGLDENFKSFNIDKVRTDGVEFFFSTNPAKKLYLKAVYTYTNAKNKSENSNLSYGSDEKFRSGCTHSQVQQNLRH